MEIRKAIEDVMVYTILTFGMMIAATALAAYNHGNYSYAIYATGQSSFCGLMAVTFAIMSVKNR